MNQSPSHIAVSKDAEPPSASSWNETLAAEVLSAENLLDTANLHSLVHAYDRLGMHDEALGVINRLTRFKISNECLLPFMLESLTRQRALPKLNQAIQLVLRMPDRSPTLRRSLACALSLLGQPGPASAEWRAVLEADAMEGADWLSLARFVAEHGDFGLAQAIDAKCLRVFGTAEENLMIFCILRSEFDANPDRAYEILQALPADEIGDAEISFELAILAFRLGDYARACAAAKHALALVPDFVPARNAVETFTSFGGQEVRELPTIRLREGVADAVHGVSAGAPRDQYTWGVISSDDNGDVQCSEKPFQSSADRDFEFSESDRPIATFSVLPERGLQCSQLGGTHADPLEVLSWLEWGVPHLMVQRERDRSMLHAFVGAPGHRDWYWREVSLKPEDCDSAPHNEEHSGVNIWEAVSDELLRREREEEW